MLVSIPTMLENPQKPNKSNRDLPTMYFAKPVLLFPTSDKKKHMLVAIRWYSMQRGKREKKSLYRVGIECTYRPRNTGHPRILMMPQTPRIRAFRFLASFCIWSIWIYQHYLYAPPAVFHHILLPPFRGNTKNKAKSQSVNPENNEKQPDTKDKISYMLSKARAPGSLQT